ncbi:molybdopterin-dependent oxidoreductase [Natrarchaeobaculum sulfurireducens]|uniref:Anaerobic dehydrogenase n=1 Tax=Natrarchaeobaculum sulfurireducens TaxID=2044521 RepID=A0A346PE54_9EURY|nr:molybdopterin-dependent oxidoreductase [Natrarchaeobaculum sulfurireducens]AXR77799.1 Anaerobic dehydrogenase [Natrarchaeobaculum sulfurireducens]
MTDGSQSLDVDRRNFVKAGGIAALGTGIGGRSLVQPSQSAGDDSEGERESVKTICSHCAVGCGLKMVVENDALVGQEAWTDHPINQGGLCSKGASLTQTVNSERRLKEPMKKEDGEWVRLDWDEAMAEVADELTRVREEYGPDSTMWMGSAKIATEEAYLFRKLAAFYGTNNVDHQARICHSTTVAGLAATWGFGAMTQSVNDVANADANLIIGHNPAEAHPVMMRYVQEAKRNGGTVIVAEPRFSKTAAHADIFARFRPGTDIAFINGLLYHIVYTLEAHDEDFLESRVYDWERVKETIADYDLETVEDITWVPVETLEEVAEALVDADVSSVEWSMGSTQHTVGTQNIRSYAILNLALGHTGQPGGGNNPVRGHDNVQGATDMCILSHNLPGYYGLGQGAWEHWTNVWDQSPQTSGSITYDEMRERFESQELMEKNGLTVSRWFEGALDDDERKGELYQPEQVKALVVWGHSLNSLSEMKRVKEALENVEIVIGVDPFPGVHGALPEREDGIILLPAATNHESEGSVTDTSRSVQWRYQAVTPRHNSRQDFELLTDLADRLGFGEHFDYDSVEDVLREINLGVRSIGLIGQTPERIKAHMENSHVFDPETRQAEVTDDHDLAGEFWGLPWPCWHDEHPGTPILYRDDVHPEEGGHDFRANWGPEAPDGESMLRAPYEPDWWDGEVEGVPQYPAYTTVLPDPETPAAKTIPIEYALSEDRSVYDAAVALAEDGYDVDPEEFEAFDNPQPDAPTGRGRARAAVWDQPDEVPVHREPVETPRPDLIDEYPNYEKQEDFYRLDLDNRGHQEAFRDLAEEFPLILTSGRQVEHHGGGYETRNTVGTANRSPMMYAEMHPRVANEHALETGDWVWVHAEPGSMLVQAMVTERVNEEEIFMPFHWAGIFEGESYADRYPEGTEPLVIGDSVNIGTSVGYDVVTNMQATKTGLCRLEPAADADVPELPEAQQSYQRQRGYTR